MARNKTLFLYNTSKQAQQDWVIHYDGVTKQIQVGAARKSFTISLSGDTTIQFGVDDTVYLKATYNYEDDSWNSNTATPNEIHFEVRESAVIVSSSFDPDE
jgi:hypothetical protein